MSDFKTGEQPCQDYIPHNGIHGLANVHECCGPYDGRPRGCYGSVSACLNCHSDHHSDGWETCGRTLVLYSVPEREDDTVSAVEEYHSRVETADPPLDFDDVLDLAARTIAELEAENKRLQKTANSQAAVLRGLTEWVEKLPEQAWEVERNAAREGVGDD